MWSSISLVSSLLLAAGIAKAQSPPGIFPQVPNLIITGFGDHMLSGGENLSPEAVAGLPQIGLPANQSQTGNRYMLMIVDLDYNAGKSKRQFSDQPDDEAHAGGQGTYLTALIENYSVSGSAFGDNGGKLLQQSGSQSAAYIPPSPSSGSNNRYMMLLFDQPLGYQMPTSLAQLVKIRTNFNIKNFINVANLPMPRYGNWFIVNGGNGSGSGGGASGSGDQSASQSGGSASSGDSQSNISSPTSSAALSEETIYSTSTLPSGGPTLTFQYTTLVGATPASTASGSQASATKSSGVVGGGGGTPTTWTFMTTTTMPNGGPTATYLTTSVGNANLGEVCVFNSANVCNDAVTTFYTTGFIGFTVLSSESVSVFGTTTMSNGRLTSYQTSSTHTYTRAFSGVSEISLSTYIARTTLTTTGTAYINEVLTTYTSTSVSAGTTTSASPVFNAAATAGPNRYIGPAVLAVAGAALAVL